MTEPHRGTVFMGTVLQTPTATELEVLADIAMVVGPDGVILAIHPAGSDAALAACATAAHVERLGSDQRLLPGLIDMHLHAPQWPQLGTGLDLPLEQWLFEYTFPLEARYADAGFAQEVWDHMVPCLLSHGTTTAVYYSSIHETATDRLAQTCDTFGQRAFVGRVAMDHPDGTPPWYRDETAGAGVAASARSIETIRSIGGAAALVRPIITPRFVPACSDQLLTGLGELAAQSGALVQTHCSESDWEHGFVLDRFGCSDTTALNRFGLLRRGTVLAHGTHLGDDDLDLIRVADAGVAHCPLSNVHFAGAVFPATRALRKNVRVGLGTDVAGGSHPGLLPQCVNAATMSRVLDDGVNAQQPPDARGVSDSRLDIVAAFHLATVGGADILDIPCGLLRPGRAFDAIVVDLGRPGSSLRVWHDLDDEARIFERIVRLATPDEIGSVWVAGRRVSG